MLGKIPPSRTTAADPSYAGVSPPLPSPVNTARPPHASRIQARNDGISKVSPETQQRFFPSNSSIASSGYFHLALGRATTTQMSSLSLTPTTAHPPWLKMARFVGGIVTVGDAYFTTGVAYKAIIRLPNVVKAPRFSIRDLDRSSFSAAFTIG